MGFDQTEARQRLIRKIAAEDGAASRQRAGSGQRLIGKFLCSMRDEGLLTACARAKIYLSRRFGGGHNQGPDCGTSHCANGRSLPQDVVFVAGMGGPSKRYRVDNVMQGLRELGYDVGALPGHLVGKLLESAPPKTVVMFRSSNYPGIPYARVAYLLRQKGVNVVMDHDDVIFNPDIVNQIDAYTKMKPGEQNLYLIDVIRYRELLLLGDSATVTTRALAREAEEIIGKAHVVPNSVNFRQLGLAEKLLSNPPKKRSGLTVMYASGTKTHDRDFEECAEALARFLGERPEARLILNGFVDLPECLRSFGDRVTRLPFLDYEKQLEEFAKVDINIAPLENNRFNAAKSELKIFEPGLVETPTIASPVDSYAEYIDDGVNGILATNSQEWYEALTRLADDPALRRSIGAAARKKTLEVNHYLKVAAKAAAAYGLAGPGGVSAATGPNFLEAPNLSRLRVAWLLANIMPGSGGHRNIFRAAYFLSKYGHDIDIYVMDSDKNETGMFREVQEFYPLPARVMKYDGVIEKCDVLFATYWTTVKPALDNRNACREVMYFVQDFEPYFFPMGTEYILAENTYRQGLYHITSGLWCENFLRNRYHAVADHFVFPVDRETYFPRKRVKQNENLIFFAKPEMSRRCYHIGVAALERFHRLRPETEIIFFGSKNVDPATLPFPITLRAYVPTLAEIAEMYSNADLGLVFSPTNPSLVPYEMMACGLPVADLEREDSKCNYGNRSDIALLADSLPEVMARQLNDLLANKTQLAERREKGLEFVKSFPTEDEMGRRVESLIKARLTQK